MTTVIGLDASTDPKKVGLVAAVAGDNDVRIENFVKPNSWGEIQNFVARYVEAGPTLVAIDAPLGWPRALGPLLAKHVAGAPLAGEPNEIFKRATDRYIDANVGQPTMSVGSDKIARTAACVMNFLDRVRVDTGFEVPLLWSPGAIQKTGVIEVYPAATLKRYGWIHTGYKRGSKRAVIRVELVKLLSRVADVPYELQKLAEKNDDALDGIVCALAGVDFIRARVDMPSDLELAKREGWIWVAAR